MVYLYDVCYWLSSSNGVDSKDLTFSRLSPEVVVLLNCLKSSMRLHMQIDGPTIEKQNFCSRCGITTFFQMVYLAVIRFL